MRKAGRISCKIEKPKDFNKALRTWKIKSRELTNEIKQRKEHEKPSAKRRKRLAKAKYIQYLRSQEAKRS